MLLKTALYFINIKNVAFALALCLSFGCKNSNQINVRVYITKTGNCYHTRECSYLGRSIIPMMLDEAIAEGYAPCQKCDAVSISLKKNKN